MTRLVIAGGGTGGHVFPGVAVAEALRAQEPGAAIRFVGTARGLEARVLPQLGYDLSVLAVSGLKTVGWGAALRGAARLPRAMWQARAVLREFAPTAVLGVGGYASGPLVLTATMMGLPTAVCEQNSIPGVTNRVLGRFVDKVFTAFAHADDYFPAAKVSRVGNPIRPAIAAALASPRADNAVPHVLVSGGSLGALAMNGPVADALIILARKMPLTITHQTGEKGLAETRQRYDAAGVAATCHAFITDMASVYRTVDLVIGRAGATTLAELTLAGLPAVFIPYPHAADNHQVTNAQALVELGGARMLLQGDLTPERCADSVQPLLADGALRRQMAVAMQTAAMPNAAAEVVAWVRAPRS